MDKHISEPMEGGKGTFVETTDEHGNRFLCVWCEKMFCEDVPQLSSFFSLRG